MTNTAVSCGQPALALCRVKGFEEDELVEGRICTIVVVEFTFCARFLLLSSKVDFPRLGSVFDVG